MLISNTVTFKYECYLFLNKWHINNNNNNNNHNHNHNHNNQNHNNSKK